MNKRTCFKTADNGIHLYKKEKGVLELKDKAKNRPSRFF